jgi:hypothetical protein
MNGKCPLQVIDDNIYENTRWILLDTHIHLDDKGTHKLGRYDNLTGFHRHIPTPKNIMENVVNGHNRSSRIERDIIRNPTIEEFLEISRVLLWNNQRFNLKTLELTNIK